MQTLFNTSLPLFPMPLSKMGFNLIQAQIGKVFEAELSSSNFRFGDPIPESIKDWFDEDDDVFKCIKGSTYTSQLSVLLKAKGTTVANFYRRLLQRVYTIRLGGEKNVEDYHIQKPEKEVMEFMKQKQEEVTEENTREEEIEEKKDSAPGGKKDEVGVAEDVEEDEDMEDMVDTEENMKQLQKYAGGKLCGKAVRDIHKNAETFGEKTVVQIIKKTVEEGKVVAMAISDGHYVSPDVLIAEGDLGEDLIPIKENELIEVVDASVKGEQIILNYAKHLKITNTSGKHLEIGKRVTAPDVTTLKKINKQTVALWAVKFKDETNVELNKEEGNFDDTILETDDCITEVGKREPIVKHIETQSQPLQSITSRSKRIKLQCPLCIRSFTSTDSLKKHMESHY